MLEFGCDPDDEDSPRFRVSHHHNSELNCIEFVVYDSYESIAESLDNQPDFVPERPADCICSDEVFNVYGCMCRRRILPG